MGWLGMSTKAKPECLAYVNLSKILRLEILWMLYSYSNMTVMTQILVRLKKIIQVNAIGRRHVGCSIKRTGVIFFPPKIYCNIFWIKYNQTIQKRTTLYTIA